MELDKVTLLRAKALLGVMLFVLGQISFGLLAGLVIVGEHAAELLIGGALLAQLIGIAGLRMSRLARSRVASLGLAGDSGY